LSIDRVSFIPLLSVQKQDMISMAINCLLALLPDGWLPWFGATGGRSEVVDRELTGASGSYRELTGHLFYGGSIEGANSKTST
jgi:hypothetical protein